MKYLAIIFLLLFSSNIFANKNPIMIDKTEQLVFLYHKYSNKPLTIDEHVMSSLNLRKTELGKIATQYSHTNDAFVKRDLEKTLQAKLDEGLANFPSDWVGTYHTISVESYDFEKNTFKISNLNGKISMGPIPYRVLFNHNQESLFIQPKDIEQAKLIESIASSSNGMAKKAKTMKVFLLIEPTHTKEKGRHRITQGIPRGMVLLKHWPKNRHILPTAENYIGSFSL